MKKQIGNTVIEFVQGDITEQDVDAVVNAANARLQLGGGVAGAIREKGGPEIQKECDKIGGIPIGTAALTTGGNLKADYVIHAVGPRIGEGNEGNKLADATLSSLKVADEHELKSIAFPAISTGIFGFPIDRCAHIMISEVVKYAQTDDAILEKIVFCLFDQEAFDTFTSAANDYFLREKNV